MSDAVAPENGERSPAPFRRVGLALTASCAVLVLVLLACSAASRSADYDPLVLGWTTLFLAPSLVLGALIRARPGTGTGTGTGNATTVLLRRFLPAAVILGLLQAQAWGAVWYVEEHVQFFGRSVAPGRVLWAGIAGLWSAAPFAAFKALLLLPLCAWNLGWILLGVATRGWRGLGVPATAWILLSGLLVGGAHVVVLPGLIFTFDEHDFAPQATDQSLIERHPACREACERLRSMIVGETQVVSVGPRTLGAWSRRRHGWAAGQRREADRAAPLAESGMTAERYQEYLRLLEQVHSYEVRRVDHDCEILVKHQGVFLRSEDAAFVWFASGTAPAGREPREGSPYHERFTALGGGWFLRSSFD